MIFMVDKIIILFLIKKMLVRYFVVLEFVTRTPRLHPSTSEQSILKNFVAF